ncbi:MAG: ABC transporter permease [Chloroflexota bacterium]
MKRYIVVARHELVTHSRRKSFLFMLIVFPLLMAGLSWLSGYVAVRQEEETGTLGQVGYVDLAGVLKPGLARPPEFQPYPDVASAATALTGGQIGAYFVLAADYLTSGRVDAYSHKAIPGGIENQFEEFIRANLLAGRTPEVAARLQEPANVTLATLDGRRTVNEESAMALILTPLLFALLLSLSIGMTSGYMMQNVVEEKETRMVEMMMTSIQPVELLWGKIIGLGALGLLQIGCWLAAALIIVSWRPDVRQMLEAISLPADLLALAVLYTLLGYVLYGSLLAGIGASSSSLQEAQSIAGIVTFVAIVPLLVLPTFLENPNGEWPTFLSLLPLTASTAMVIRLALGQVPAWQVALSVGLLGGSVAAVVWLAAWAFRVGLLLTGQRLPARAIFRRRIMERG